MPKKAQPYRETLLDNLRDPQEATAYLKAALEDSPEMLLVALKDVADAYQISQVAKEAGVTRESLYKMLSKTGNPTYGSLTAVLQALGLKISVEPAGGAEKPGEPLAGYYRNPPIRTGIDPSPTQTASAEAHGKQRKQKISKLSAPGRSSRRRHS